LLNGDIGQSANHVGLEVEENRAVHVFAAQGFVINYVDAVEVRIVAVGVLAELESMAIAMRRRRRRFQQLPYRLLLLHKTSA
jgi:hypothetical protein